MFKTLTWLIAQNATYQLIYGYALLVGLLVVVERIGMVVVATIME